LGLKRKYYGDLNNMQFNKEDDERMSDVESLKNSESDKEE
jgi:hypothetical protein